MSDEETKAPARKTPSPRVIASLVLIEAYGKAMKFDRLTVSDLADSSVSDAKLLKVRDEMAKMMKRTVGQAHKYVERFRNPPPSTPKAFPGRKKKAEAAGGADV